eukprot:Rmarinus@m.23355
MAEKLKLQGNELFKAKKYEEASRVYSEAIKNLKKDTLSNSDVEDIYVALLSNRAACYLNSQKYQECVQDCDSVLKRRPTHLKTLYRRAQANEKLGLVYEASQDAQNAVKFGAKTPDAVSLARRLASLASEEGGPLGALVSKHVKSLRDEAISGKARTDTLLSLLDISREPNGASLMIRRGVPQLVGSLWPPLLGETVEPKRASQENVVAARILAVLLRASGMSALSAAQQATKQGQSEGTCASAEHTAGVDMLKLIESLSQAIETVTDASEKHFRDFVSVSLDLVTEAGLAYCARDAHTQSSQDPQQAGEKEGHGCDGAVKKGKERAQVAEALANMLVLAVRACPGRFVIQRGGVDGCIRLSQSRIVTKALASHGVLPLLAELVRSRELRQRFSGGEAGSVSRSSVSQDQHTGSSGSAEEGVDESELEAVSAMALASILNVLEEADAKKALNLSLYLESRDMAKNEVGLALLRSFLLVRRESAIQTLESGRLMERVSVLVEDGTPRARELGCEIVGMLVSDDKGKATVPESLVPAMKEFLSHKGRVVRARAAVAVAKLSVKEVVQNPSEMVKVLALLLDESLPLLVEEKNIEGVETSKKEIVIGRAKEIVECVMEAVSCLSFHATFKEKVVYEDVSGETLLKRLLRVSRCARKVSVGYGLAFSLAQVSMAFDPTKRKGAASELSDEQIRQLQKMMKLPGQEDPLEDTAELASKRVAILVENNAAGILGSLPDVHKNARLGEIVSQCLLNMAVPPEQRGSLIQQGAVSTLLKLVALPVSLKKQAENAESGGDADDVKPVVVSGGGDDEDNTDKQSSRCARAASHALAKIAISTNPAMLPGQQVMAIIPAVLPLCDDDNGLVQFEALLALTNIASLSFETKDRLVQAGAIPKFESVLFLDHVMLRRAACEAMCNLLPHEDMFKYFCRGERAKLWLALSLGEEDDFDTARAAAGALAMASQDADVAAEILKFDGVKTFQELVCGEEEEMVHRGVEALRSLSEAIPAAVAAIASNNDLLSRLQLLEKLRTVASKSSQAQPSAALAISEAAGEILKRVQEREALDKHASRAA